MCIDEQVLVYCHYIFPCVSIVVVDESSCTIFYLKIFVYLQHYLLLTSVTCGLDVLWLAIMQFDGKIKQGEVLIHKVLRIVCMFLHELLRKIFQIVFIVFFKLHLFIIFLGLFFKIILKMWILFPTSVEFVSLLLAIH